MRILAPTMTEQEVKIHAQTQLHVGFCPVEYYQLQHKLFNGNWSETYTREVVAKPPAVAVLPYNPRLGQVVLIEQFRLCALNRSPTPWLIEVVAGVMESTEQELPEEAARRELREEAGLEASTLLPIYDYFTSPGYSTEKVALFCARIDVAQVPEFGGLSAEQEDIKIHLLPVAEAFAAVRSGHINNGITIIALQWLELNLTRINQLWA